MEIDSLKLLAILLRLYFQLFELKIQMISDISGQ